MIVTTVAGGAAPPTPMPALSASVGYVERVATDSAGNLYFASSLHCVFKVDSSGVMTRVAGTCRAGYSGDGGPATSAMLNYPSGVAADASGGLYIAEFSNNRVRRVSASGTITTVAGGGDSGDGGPATSAVLDGPTGVAVDTSGNVYITEYYSNRVRKVSTSGTITTVAGTGASGHSGDGGPAINALLYGPVGVGVDAAGNVYIADSGNSRVRKISVSGTITTVAGNGSGGYSGDGGLATGAMLNVPWGVSVDASGNLYIADTSNDSVRKVSTSGIITTVVGNAGGGYAGDGGPAASAKLTQPAGVAVDSLGNLYIADSLNNRARKVSVSGIITTVAGNGVYSFWGDGGPATSAMLADSRGAAVDASGNLYIADFGNARVRRVSTSGTITTVAGSGQEGYSGDGGPAAIAMLDGPLGVAVDASGNLYIGDVGSSRVRMVSTSGTITTAAGSGQEGYSGDGGPATSAMLDSPGGVAVDASGNLYIADSNNNRVRKVSASGTITTVAGNGSSSFSGDGGPATSAALNPYGVAVDASGNVYIADLSNSRVRRVSPDGIITTVAGTGQFAYSGDGGPATGATLTYPFGVTVDATGNVYVADSGNNAIRRLQPVAALASLSISSSHSGSFSLGQTGATYSVAVGNGASAGSTIGAVTVTETPPGGLTLVSMSGAGWTCPANTCTRSDALNAGASYPAITVTVNVSANASSPQVNQAGVSGGGSFPASASDSAVVGSPVSVTVTTIPSGMSITVDGSALISPQILQWASGSQHSIGVISPQNVGSTPYNFSGWSDGGVLTHTITAPSVTTTYTANFIAAGSGFYFYPVTPCRVADTRGNGKSGAFGPPGISGGSSRDFPIPASGCGIPSGGAAYSLNVTVLPPGQLTYLTAWPTGQPRPTVSTLNDFSTQTATPGNVVANAAIAPAGTNGAVSVFVSDTSDVILDVNGYFAPPGAGGLAFYPVTPCRVADTRGNGMSGPFGPPTMAGGSNRNFPIQQGGCNVPSTAQAYSLNMTVVPPLQLTYLTTWPAGQSQPVVSTLNDFSTQSSTLDLGRVVANAAIVPAGANGAVSVFLSEASDVIIDINGYFAAPGGSGALSFYTAAPCRVADTRGNGFSGAFGAPSMTANATRGFPIPLSPCNTPSGAQAYSLNLTVVPPNQLTYLATWPAGQSQPVVSTLNDFSTGTIVPGRVVANAAIVPAGANGAVNIFTSDATDVIIDINGYFAP